MTGSLARNGAGGMLSDLSMNGFRIKNHGAATSGSDLVTLDQVNSVSVPIGGSIDWWSDDLPSSNWVFMYGQELSRTEYPDLFARFGTRYGSGNGTTTFNIPDCRGVSVVGKVNMGGGDRGILSRFTATVLGAFFGTQEVALTVNEMPSHNHGGTSGSAGGHTHNISLQSRGTGGGDSPNSPAWNIRTSTNYGNRLVGTQSAGEHTHSIQAQGGGSAHLNVQPSLVANKILRVR